MNMQRLIKGLVSNLRIYIILFLYVTLFGGCSSLMLKENQQSKRILSCEEKAQPKSLLYLEQQYRCTAQGEEN